MKKYSIIALIISILMGGSSCKKETESIPRKQTIIAKSWKMTSFIMVDTTGAEEEMFSALFQPCRQDNLYQFAADGSYKQDEGATKCDTTDQQIYETGTWTISSDESKMTLTPSGETTSDLTFVSFSANEVKLKGVDPIFGPIRISFKAQ